MTQVGADWNQLVLELSGWLQVWQNTRAGEKYCHWELELCGFTPELIFTLNSSENLCIRFVVSKKKFSKKEGI